MLLSVLTSTCSRFSCATDWAPLIMGNKLETLIMVTLKGGAQLDVLSHQPHQSREHTVGAHQHCNVLPRYVIVPTLSNSISIN
jgi:hypothetical protein